MQQNFRKITLLKIAQQEMSEFHLCISNFYYMQTSFRIKNFMILFDKFYFMMRLNFKINDIKSLIRF